MKEIFESTEDLRVQNKEESLVADDMIIFEKLENMDNNLAGMGDYGGAFMNINDNGNMQEDEDMDLL